MVASPTQTASVTAQFQRLIQANGGSSNSDSNIIIWENHSEKLSRSHFTVRALQARTRSRSSAPTLQVGGLKPRLNAVEQSTRLLPKQRSVLLGLRRISAKPLHVSLRASTGALLSLPVVPVCAGTNTLSRHSARPLPVPSQGERVLAF